MSKKLDPTDLINKAKKALGQKRKKFPDFKVGDTIRVFVKVKEGSKTRLQPFEGIVIKRKKNLSFTVRKIASGIGVERVFSYDSPVIDKIILVSTGHVRRARLYYLRGLRGRKARVKSDLVFDQGPVEEEEPKDADAKAAEGAESREEPKAAQA